MTQVLDRVGPVRPSRQPAAAHAPGPAPRKFRPDIEGLRAFAVVSVVLYHANLGVRGGYVGVDVFFVISGFLITRQLVSTVGVKGFTALPTFYSRRIRRLLPASATVVITTVLVARVVAPALQVKPIATDAIFTTFYSLNYRLAAEGTQYLHQGDSVSPLQHFWSLGVEEQYYLFWPVIIALLALVGRRHRHTLIFVVLAGATAFSYYLSVTVTRHSQSWAYFSLQTRAWELGLGALVALGAQQLSALPSRVAELAGWLGLTLAVGSAFAFSDSTQYPGSLAAVPVVGAALVIAAGCGRRRKVERVLGEPLMQCLGRVSYSWYLWHWPMLIMIPMIVGHPLGVLSRAGVIWLSLVTAIVSFFVIEEPMRLTGRTTRSWFIGGAVITAAVLVVSMLVIAYPRASVGTGAAVSITKVDSSTPAALAEVQQAIEAGVATGAAPRNLTPEPAAAAEDTPPSSSDGCHADYLVVKQPACVFGDPAGTHTAVLFGDSHMEQWLPAFDAAAKQAHWRIINWTKAACPPAQLSVFAPVLNRQYTECNTWRSQTLARIADLHPDLVFVSQSENVVSSSVSPSTWTSATLQTLNELRSTTGAKVEFIQDIPIPNFDIPTCVARSSLRRRQVHVRDEQGLHLSQPPRRDRPGRGRGGLLGGRSQGVDLHEYEVPGGGRQFARLPQLHAPDRHLQHLAGPDGGPVADHRPLIDASTTRSFRDVHRHFADQAQPAGPHPPVPVLDLRAGHLGRLGVQGRPVPGLRAVDQALPDHDISDHPGRRRASGPVS